MSKRIEPSTIPVEASVNCLPGGEKLWPYCDPDFHSFLGIGWLGDRITAAINQHTGHDTQISPIQWQVLLAAAEAGYRAVHGPTPAIDLPSWLAGFEAGSKAALGQNPSTQASSKEAV